VCQKLGKQMEVEQCLPQRRCTERKDAPMCSELQLSQDLDPAWKPCGKTSEGSEVPEKA
jgi:hypothetical protein